MHREALAKQTTELLSPDSNPLFTQRLRITSTWNKTLKWNNWATKIFFFAIWLIHSRGKNIYLKLMLKDVELITSIEWCAVFMTGVSEWVINGVPNRRDLKQEMHDLVPNMASRWQATGPCQSSVGVVYLEQNLGKKRPGWMISRHLSALQGVIFRGWKTRSCSFLRSDLYSRFASPVFEFLCHQIPQWQLHN